MAINILTMYCVLGRLVSSIYCQCLPQSTYNFGLYSVGPTYNACPITTTARELIAADGGGFAVTSASPTPPYGVSVVSENEYSGTLGVAGQLPFLGTAYLDGAVPSAGAGAVIYGCGYGDVAIVEENFAGANRGLEYTTDLISRGGSKGCRGCGCSVLV